MTDALECDRSPFANPGSSPALRAAPGGNGVVTDCGTVAVFSSGVARIPAIEALLGARRMVLRPRDSEAKGIDAVVGWGCKPSSRAARAYAERHGLPFWRVEDGFLRSVGLGVRDDPSLSIVVDDLGIYYDARSESRLERILAGGDGCEDPLATPEILDRARRAIDAVRESGLSKYNDAPPGPIDLGPPASRVLVVDQTAGDLSVTCGLASRSTFTEMLSAALSENPGAEVVVKTHPDVVAGAKRGYLERCGSPRVRVWARSSTPADLFAAVDRVYVVTSQLGFEALLWDKPVTCFGAPWYAGWGATDDRAVIPRRGRRRAVEELFAAAYLLYARYLEPGTARPGRIEQVVEHLALQRAMFARNQGTLLCFGFQFWKRNYVRAYLRCPGNRIVFRSSPAGAERAGFDPTRSRIVVWGRESEGVRRLAARHSLPIWRVEDGFLRSVGLGSDLNMPASLVFDSSGIYYDPTRPSELESILETAELTAGELERARVLRDLIVESGLSKYNVGGGSAMPAPAGRRVLLVPGQVEDDASVRLGCEDVRTNLGLLEAVRRSRPSDFVLYKPHPDVVSGNRRGAIDPERTRSLCDQIEEEASLACCLEMADEVHTLTSLVGFEALLRGKRVVVYGQPFYSGWGLTEDRHPVPRRSRLRTVDELVACALVRYPRYLDRRLGHFASPEATIAALLDERDANAVAHRLKVSWALRQLRRVFNAYRGLVHAP